MGIIGPHRWVVVRIRNNECAVPATYWAQWMVVIIILLDIEWQNWKSKPAQKKYFYKSTTMDLIGRESAHGKSSYSSNIYLVSTVHQVPCWTLRRHRWLFLSSWTLLPPTGRQWTQTASSNWEGTQQGDGLEKRERECLGRGSFQKARYLRDKYPWLAGWEWAS